MTRVNPDAGAGDRLALAVLAQYRMATTEQVHLVVSPGVRIEQTRRRLAKLRAEGLVDRITLAQAGRTRVWFSTVHGARIVFEWPELRGRRPSRLVGDRSAVRLRTGHALTVTETALAFLQDARHRGDLFRPLDWIPEVQHPLGSGEAVIPDALMYYRSQGDAGGHGSMMRAFLEIDRATMGPERLAAKIPAYARLHTYSPAQPGRRRIGQEPPQEEWRKRYPVFPRLLFVLANTGPAGIETRIDALQAAAALDGGNFLHKVPVLAAPLADLLRDGPTAPIWRPLTDPSQRVSWICTRPGPDSPPAAGGRTAQRIAHPYLAPAPQTVTGAEAATDAQTKHPGTVPRQRSPYPPRPSPPLPFPLLVEGRVPECTGGYQTPHRPPMSAVTCANFVAA
ncbi:replication-relaxation family protein [Streptomyces sp. NPDC057950]|uniref:replication-relaxation family protein n=1 Tax=Streptomyces sp. NPDC057950 TaxID=3346288 RepID=UPI0036E72D63